MHLGVVDSLPLVQVTIEEPMIPNPSSHVTWYVAPVLIFESGNTDPPSMMGLLQSAAIKAFD